MSVRVYWLDCRKVDPADGRVLALMSPARRQKLAELIDSGARRRSMAAELALALALARERSIPLRIVEWRALPGGKPVIEGGFCISLSHSGDAAVCAICEQNVGVDVEAPRNIDPRMRRKVFSPEEQEDEDRRLLETWVAKECYLKMTGEGLSCAMTEFSAVDGEIRDAYGKKLAYLHAIEAPLPGYVLRICTQYADNVRLIELDW